MLFTIIIQNKVINTNAIYNTCYTVYMYKATYIRIKSHRHILRARIGGYIHAYIHVYVMYMHIYMYTQVHAYIHVYVKYAVYAVYI